MSADKTTTQQIMTQEPRQAPAPGETLRNANLEDLFLSALCGGEEISVRGAIEAIAKDIEPLYEYFCAREERWVAGNLFQAQHRLRVLAEFVRRREARANAMRVS